MASDSTDVGGRIRAARLAAGLTQDELAEAIGIKQQSVTKWETGAGSITTAILALVAQVLDVSTDYLLGIEDDPMRRAAAQPTDDVIHIAASGVDLNELRDRDREAYDQIIQLARIALDRARERGAG